MRLSPTASLRIFIRHKLTMTPSPRASEWHKLPLSLTELCIDTTLRCGQAFRWRKINDEWHCALQGRLLSLKQDETHLHYKTTWPAPDNVNLSKSTTPSSPPSLHEDDTLSLLSTYFNLPISLSDLYSHFSASDANFALRAPSFTGIRILNQPSFECLISFICSSNNHISRISSMVSKLATAYGAPIATLDGEAFHDFPTPKMLNIPGVEERLRALGFGYRARYIAETARMLDAERPAGWLDGLRNPRSPAIGSAVSTPQTKPTSALTEEPADHPPPSYQSAHASLLTLPGVGPKVSDCVCLMGLGWHEAVPVDTHVWQIATRDYGFGLGRKGLGKTFNKAVHDAVGEHFRGIWGEYAGWAQSVLFTANLRSFAEQAGGVSPRKKGRKGEGVVETVKVEEKEAVVKVEEKAEEEKVEKTTMVRKRKITAIVTEGDVVGCGTENGELGKALLPSTRKSRRIKEQTQGNTYKVSMGHSGK